MSSFYREYRKFIWSIAGVLFAAVLCGTVGLGLALQGGNVGDAVLSVAPAQTDSSSIDKDVSSSSSNSASASSSSNASSSSASRASSSEETDTAKASSYDGGSQQGESSAEESGQAAEEAKNENQKSEPKAESDSEPAPEPEPEPAPAPEPEPEPEPEPVPAAQNIFVGVIITSSAAEGQVNVATTVELPQGATVYDALAESGVALNTKNTSSGVYVVGINGLNEKDYGGGSGWTYYVNGAFPLVAASGYVLSDGDTVDWIYVV